MELFVFFSADEHEELLQHYVLCDDVEGLGKLSFSLNKADDLFCDWALSGGGKAIFHAQGEGIVCIPVDRADILPKIKEEYEVCVGHVSVGVGRNLLQAQKACRYAKAHGGSRIVLFGPEMENMDMTGDLSKSEDSNVENDNVSVQSSDGGSDSSETSANTKAQIKQVAVEVLKQVQDNMQTIEALKEQDPNAYESIRAVVEVMLMMADNLVGKDENSKEESKSEEKESEPETLEKANKGHRKSKIKYPKGSSSRGAKLPVGSIRGGKIKVQFSDGSYKWVSVQAAAKLHSKTKPNIKKTEDDLEKVSWEKNHHGDDLHTHDAFEGAHHLQIQTRKGRPHEIWHEKEGDYWKKVGEHNSLSGAKAMAHKHLDKIIKKNDDLEKGVRKLYIRTKQPLHPAKPKIIKPLKKPVKLPVKKSDVQ